jgi:hypothetical protein
VELAQRRLQLLLEGQVRTRLALLEVKHPVLRTQKDNPWKGEAMRNWLKMGALGFALALFVSAMSPKADAASGYAGRCSQSCAPCWSLTGCPPDDDGTPQYCWRYCP